MHPGNLGGVSLEGAVGHPGALRFPARLREREHPVRGGLHRGYNGVSHIEGGRVAVGVDEGLDPRPPVGHQWEVVPVEDELVVA